MFIGFQCREATLFRPSLIVLTHKNWTYGGGALSCPIQIDYLQIISGGAVQLQIWSQVEMS